MVQLALAFRYLRRRGVTIFALLSVMVGATAFIVVMGVMDGYSVEFNRRSRDMLGDIVVSVPNYAIRAADSKVARLLGEPVVEAAVANVGDFGILKIPETDATSEKRFAIEWCRVVGIDPAAEFGVVRPKLEPELGPEDFATTGKRPNAWIVLGSDLMKAHDLKVGDPVWLVTSRQTGIDRVRTKKKLTVIGSLSFGLFEQDREMAFVHRSVAIEMRGYPPDCATEIRLRLTEGVDLATGVERVRHAIGPTDAIRNLYQVVGFQQTSNMFRAIESQRSLSRFILFFLFLISGLAIVAVLFLIVLEKRHDIGLLRSVGLPSRGVAGTFLTYAGVVAVVGAGLGVLVGWGILSRLDALRVFVRTQTGFDPFPTHLYHLETIPWVIEPVNPIMVLTAALVISLLAGIIPALWAASLDPIEGLSGE